VSSAERAWRYRARRRGELPPVTKLACTACGRIHTGARGELCSRCWTSTTPEGRADRAARVARSRTRRRMSVTDGELATAEPGLP
jgi:hypothetical protein